MNTSRPRYSPPPEGHRSSRHMQRLYWGLSFATGYYNLGRHADALRELDALGKIHQDRVEVMNLRSRILLAMEDWEAAITECRRATRLKPHSADAYIQAAYAYDRLDKPLLARDIWNSAPETIRSTPFYHYNVARCEVRLGNVESATQHVKAVLDMAPELFATLAKDPALMAIVAKAQQE